VRRACIRFRPARINRAMGERLREALAGGPLLADGAGQTREQAGA